MRRFRVVLRDGTRATIHGDVLGFTPRDHPYATQHLCIKDFDGNTVFASGSREVAYVADIDAIELPDVTAPHARDVRSSLARWLDVASKGVAILSSLAMVAFVILIATGHSHVGSVQAESLLTVFAFTLVGGIISIGGVQLFSVSANLRRANQRVEVIERTVAGSGDSNVRLVRTTQHRFETDDADTLHQLQSVRSNNLLDDYLVICAASPTFRAEIERVARRERRNGWALTGISPNDNLQNGLVLNLTFEKAM
jgi:hypothetical protein